MVYFPLNSTIGLPWWLRGKRIGLQCRRPSFDPWVRKILWRREWLPTPVFFPGNPPGQRSLVGYSPWGHKESDTIERVSMCKHTHTHTHTPPSENQEARSSVMVTDIQPQASKETRGRGGDCGKMKICSG